MDAETKMLVTHVAEEAAQKAVDRTLTGLGVDMDQPLEFQRDMAHLRRWRRAVDSAGLKGLTVLMGFMVIGVCALVYLGVTTKFVIK